MTRLRCLSSLQLNCSDDLTLANLERLKRIFDFSQDMTGQLWQYNIATEQIGEIRSKIEFIRKVLASDYNAPTLRFPSGAHIKQRI